MVLLCRHSRHARALALSLSCHGRGRELGLRARRRQLEGGVRKGETHLLHDSSFTLGKGDVSARLVADELDLDLAALAAALLIIVVVVVVGGGTLALDATALRRGAAIADGVRLVEVVGRSLVVLIRDVGHCVQMPPIQSMVSHRLEKVKSGGDAVLSVVPMDLY